MKYDKVEVGMVLYDRHTHRAGNTTMRVLGEWRVVITEVKEIPGEGPAIGRTIRIVKASWNGNPPKMMNRRDIEKLKTWSKDDDCAEVKEGMVGTISVKLKKGFRPPPPRFVAPQVETRIHRSGA